jgi:hypothetical protein
MQFSHVRHASNRCQIDAARRLSKGALSDRLHRSKV